MVILELISKFTLSTYHLITPLSPYQVLSSIRLPYANAPGSRSSQRTRFSNLNFLFKKVQKNPSTLSFLYHLITDSSLSVLPGVCYRDKLEIRFKSVNFRVKSAKNSSRRLFSNGKQLLIILSLYHLIRSPPQLISSLIPGPYQLRFNST